MSSGGKTTPSACNEPALRVRAVLAGQTARISWLIVREAEGAQVRHFIVSPTGIGEAMKQIRPKRDELTETILSWVKRGNHGQSARFESAPCKPMIQAEGQTYYVWKEVIFIR